MNSCVAPSQNRGTVMQTTCSERPHLLAHCGNVVTTFARLGVVVPLGLCRLHYSRSDAPTKPKAVCPKLVVWCPKGAVNSASANPTRAGARGRLDAESDATRVLYKAMRSIVVLCRSYAWLKWDCLASTHHQGWCLTRCVEFGEGWYAVPS